jgi:hypothetical protein
VGIIHAPGHHEGKKASQMHAPVKAYMTRKIITGSLCTTVRELEEIFFKRGVGQIPIMDGGKNSWGSSRGQLPHHIYPDRASGSDNGE